MSDEHPPDHWFSRPSLDPRAADRARRRAVASAAAPPATWVPEAGLAAVFSALLLLWAAHAVLPT
jgi:hypothetical protein